MDQLPALGTTISRTVAPTQRIYCTLLQEKADEIKSTPRKTFTYGTDPRQQLDVYFPSSKPTGAGCPILIFMYGGGLVNGAKTLSTIENELVYANLGHFFADRCGFVVVIPDYRLVPQARFPSGGEDISLAVAWTRDNLKQLGGSDDPRDLFLMGNSAGGIHITTYLLSSIFAESRKQIHAQDGHATLQLRGVVYVSTPFHFNQSASSRAEVLNTYYGDRLQEDCPLGLLKSLKAAGSVSETLPGVKFQFLTATLDPEDEVLIPNHDFLKVWREGDAADGEILETQVMMGHNHISPVLALSTGIDKEEAWALDAANFCALARGDLSL